MKNRPIVGFSERGRQHLINELCTIYQPLVVARYLNEKAIVEYLRQAVNGFPYVSHCIIEGSFIGSDKKVCFDNDDFEYALNLQEDGA